MWKFPKYEIDQPLDWENLSQSYAWIMDMQGVPQDPIWHAEGDVYIHTQMVVAALIELPEFQNLSAQDKHILITASLLHDVEKRSTTVEEDLDGKVRIVSPRHAKKGEFTARVILYKEMNTPFEVREQICKLVRLHGLPIWAITKEDPAKAVIYASQVVNTKHLAMLAKADVLGRICQDQSELLLKIELFKELCKENDCFGQAKVFPSNYGRFLYLNKDKISLDYDPFDDLICTVTLMCALPGSGKDTYLQRNLEVPVLSLDKIRRIHEISPTDKRKNGQVIQLAQKEAKAYLRAKTSFVFNATNITSEMRSKWISLFTDYNARVKIIYIEVPFKTLKKQNANRVHKVPEKILEKMIAKLEIPTPKEAHELEFVIKE
ncbi:MAG: AAA family ATPase [Saprospiraceae bacterium]